jgi:glycosyltransferase involved in cell wall biosynthesis
MVMPERIRVAFAIDNMEAGGTELNAVRLAERLDRGRFDLRVVCMRQEGPLAARYAAAGVPVESFPIPSLYGRAAVRQGARLARFLRAQRISIVHAHDIYSNVFAVPWARLAGARTIASRRWWEGFQAPAWRLASRVSYRAAHAVLANSPAIKRLLVDAEGVPPSRVVVVPNFVDESAFERIDEAASAALRQELRLGGAAPIVGVVANLLPVKDHAVLLRAAAILRPRFPRLRVVLVGDGPCRPALERLAGELGLAGTIVFAGRRGNVPNLHQLFDISVLCSTSEGLPNSILEAMAAGRPVVATQVGAVADAVADGETGMLVPPADEVRLAAALDQLSADRARAARFGRAGAARARADYSADAALKALEGLYSRLADRAISRGSRPTVSAGHRRRAAGEPADSVRHPTASRAS